MASQLPPGTQVGHLTIQTEIGRGGMGVIYRATDSALHRPVAIKLLAPHLANDSDALARFNREAAAAARLHHQHIAPVYEFGEHDGQPYIAFRWIEGRNLKTVIAVEGKLSAARVLRLFAQLADALDYAHRHGVVHRDIKPSNIIIDPEDNATLVDFGLAWLDASSTLTSANAIIGTPLYMSPEQIRSEKVDGRSDLYSFAVVAFEALCGAPPFDDESIPALFHKQNFALPPAITEINPSLPSAMNAVMTQALAKKPDDRFQSASEFIGALKSALSSLLTPELSPDILELKKTRRTFPIWQAAVIVILLCLCAAMSLALLTLARQNAIAELPTASSTEIAQVAPTTRANPTITVAPTLTVSLPITAPLESGAWIMTSGDSAQTGLLPDKLGKLNSKPRWKHDPQGNDGTTLVAGGGIVVYGNDGGIVRALDWSSGDVYWETPLGAKIVGPPALAFADNYALTVVATEDRELHALNAWEGKKVWRKTGDALHGSVPGGVTLGADNTIYAATDSGWVHAFNSEDGKVSWSLDLSKSDRFRNQPAVTGLAIYVAGANQWLHAIDPTAHEQAWQSKTNGAPTTAPCVDANSGIVFVGTDKGWVHAFSVLGKEVWKSQLSAAITGLATDGTRVYATASDGSLAAWTIATGKQEWAFKTGSAIAAAPLADGKNVIVTTRAGDVRFIDAENGKEAGDLRLTLREPISFTPAPAGGWLFVRGAAIYALGP